MTKLKWFGKIVSRWIARARASREVLMIVFFGVTALSTFTNVARDYLSFSEMVVVDLLFLVGVVAFMFFGDILNFFVSQQRDLQDIRSNFLAPQAAMMQLIRGEQLKILGEYMNGELSEEEFKMKVDGVTRSKIREYRNGMEVSK